MKIRLSDEEMSDKIEAGDLCIGSITSEEIIYVGLQQYDSDHVCVDRILYFLYGAAKVAGSL